MVTSSEWAFGARQLSTVSDWRKLIRDFRDQFPFDPPTALIVETFANALDAGASRIDVLVQKGIYRITDNGKGMTQDGIREYHNIASLSKRRGGETIGFAGVGAKIFLDRAKYVITETKSKHFQGATYWAFRDGSLEWEPTKSPNKVQSPTGTFVEVRLCLDEDINTLTPQFARSILRQQYNAILLGLYKTHTITVNGKTLQPWQIPDEQVDKRKDFRFKQDTHWVRGFFIKSRKPVPEEYQGPFIVVHGKTVTQEWFRQYPIDSEEFHGLILADYLIDILRTSKSDFERTSMKWRQFHNRMGRILATWLDELGERPATQEIPTTLDKMSREVEKSVNKVLKKPEFSDLANTFFEDMIRRNIAAKTAQAAKVDASVAKQETVQVPSSQQGEIQVQIISEGTAQAQARRRTRGLLRIGFEDKSEELLEGWIDPGKQAIIINTGHPAWRTVDSLALQTGDERVRIYHIMRAVFAVLAEEDREPQAVLANLFSSWCDAYVKGCKRRRILKHGLG